MTKSSPERLKKVREWTAKNSDARRLQHRIRMYQKKLMPLIEKIKKIVDDFDASKPKKKKSRAKPT